VADALSDAGISPTDLRGKRGGIILGNSMGGETTDRHAAWGLARALHG
jgi:acyl transferase domain-containing protein